MVQLTTRCSQQVQISQESGIAAYSTFHSHAQFGVLGKKVVDVARYRAELRNYSTIATKYNASTNGGALYICQRLSMEEPSMRFLHSPPYEP